MMTPFNLIQSLRSWFFARDGDIVLQDGRAIKISNADITITTGGIVITGGTVTIGGAAVSVAGHVHTHASTTSQTTDDHHPQSHNVASHSDTSATGTELNTLTDGSDASSLHIHDARYFQESEFSSNPGASSKPLESDSSGELELEGLGVGTAPTTNDIRAAGDIVATNDVYAANDSRTAGDLKAGLGLTVGNATSASLFGVIKIRETSTPGTPTSGFVYIWAATTGRVYSKDDTGTVRELSNV